MNARAEAPSVAIMLPSFAPQDAIGAHSVGLAEALRGLGIETVIVADEIRASWEGGVTQFRKFKQSRPRKNRYLIYQSSTVSNLYPFLMERGETLIVQYHNITPRRQVTSFAPGLATALAAGRRQFQSMAKATSLAIAVSEFNAREMVREGYGRVAVVPPIIADLPTATGSRSYGGAVSDVVFVGRIVPNKAQAELIRTVAVYNATFPDKVRLRLIGSSTVPSYMHFLQLLTEELGVKEHVSFESGLDGEALAAAYAQSHLYSSASHHEGFGFPVVESMRAGLPVVAVGEAAIPETVGSAALLVPVSAPEVIATAWHSVLADAHLRQILVRRGHQRAADFERGAAADANLAALANVIPLSGVRPAPLYHDASSAGGLDAFDHADEQER